MRHVPTKGSVVVLALSEAPGEVAGGDVAAPPQPASNSATAQKLIVRFNGPPSVGLTHRG